MAGPSQPSVTDEVWNNDRIKSFLAQKPYGDVPADFHVLLIAYRGMRSEDFERFLHFFLAEGRDLDAKDRDGQTLWQIIAEHRMGAKFLSAKQRVTE